MSGSSSTTSKTASFPEGASCWLCLEEGPDDTGAPLVRDCSCRGHSGFAHLPCLIKYAESKSMEYVERGTCCMHDGELFREKFFSQCPNCKQSFQGDIAYEMAKYQLSFIEREFKEVICWNFLALMRRIAILDEATEADRMEGEEISDKLLALVGDDMGNCNPSVDFMSVAVAYQYIGTFHFNVGDGKSLEKAKYYYEKARDISNTIRDKTTRVVFGSIVRDDETLGSFINSAIEKNLSEIEARMNGDSLEAATALSSLRVGYNYIARSNGKHAVETISHGIRLVKALSESFHTIEALRLIDELQLTCRRVHGSDHRETKMVNLWRQRLKIRYVVIAEHLYQALRYENDGNTYVVNGPVNSAGEIRSDDEEAFAVPSADITFTHSLPVMFHGLKKDAHLNGEIGDIRDLCQLSGRWVVHLEGKGLKPVKVKQENLRIVFDLPEPRKESP
jgi:hypothetical protein